MSNKALTWVWENSKSKGSTRLVLFAIADNCDDAGCARSGVGRIAKKCAMDARSVQRHIAKLEKLGELVVITGKGVKTISGWTNLYVIPAVATMVIVNARPVLRRRQGVTHLSPDGVTELPPHEGQGVTHLSPDGVTDLSPKPKAIKDISISDDTGEIAAPAEYNAFIDQLAAQYAPGINPVLRQLMLAAFTPDTLTVALPEHMQALGERYRRSLTATAKLFSYSLDLIYTTEGHTP